MKIVFLDIDGTLNNWAQEDKNLETGRYYEYDNECVKILKKIVDLSNAKVVITSSAKYGFQRENEKYEYSAFYKIFVKPLIDNGIDVIGVTPYLKNKSSEISKYIKDNKIDDYVILDDELLDCSLWDHQVLVDLYLGLREKHIMPSFNILSGKLGFYPKNYDKSKDFSYYLSRSNDYYSKHVRIKKK